MPNKFYFAWVNPGTAFNPAVHNVNDEKIVSWSVEQIEGEFATLVVRIKNPRIGFLNAGRKLWAYLSWDNGSSIVPLLFGRIVGIPSSLQSEIVQVDFVARPVDYADQKLALAETLRILPYYDPVFIATNKALDPDVVLEGRTEAWHIDRVTHHVTTSDYIVGDSTLTFTGAEFTYGELDVTFDQPPIRKVRMTASVFWDQAVAGSVNGLQLLKNYHVNTVAGAGLIKGWPDRKAGDPEKKLNGGWTCVSSRAASPYTNMTDVDFGKWMGDSFRLNNPPFAVKIVQTYASTLQTTPEGTDIDADTTYFCVLTDSVFLDLTLGYASNRKRSDTVIFELVADTQPILTDPETNDVLDLNISGNDVGIPLEVDGDYAPPPIGDVQRRSYFVQDRGRNSLQYLLQLARAHIIMRARAVRIVFKCTFARAVELSLRKNVRVLSPRLPGGEATGKVVHYSFKAESGEISGTCTIACAIGRGGVWTELAGTPCYASAGYMSKGYQVYTGERIILGADDVAFYPLVEAAADDGLVFPLSDIPVIVAPHTVTVETVPLTPVQPFTTSETVSDDCNKTINAALHFSIDTGPYTTWLAGVKTTVDFTLPSIDGGPFDTVYPLVATTLKIPKQIDLEAASL